MSETSVISVKNLSQRYGRGRIIYENLSFEVPKGRILGLLGKNGTGKTTTINILMGFLKPQSGECRIFGEDITSLTPETRSRIALLLEGHVQYSFMTISQIEKFYSKFYPRWNSEAYYGLMKKLKVTPDQKISSMSNGQRSQVKTVFMTSHIIQDLERLIDDCIIMDYGKILTQMPVDKLMGTLKRYSYTGGALPKGEGIFSPWSSDEGNEFYSFISFNEARQMLDSLGIEAKDLKAEAPESLEDAFIGLTGRY